MSQNPSQGGPPEGGDQPASPWGQPGGWQPPSEPQHPQSGPEPQPPSPGTPPGWHPPPSGAGPPSDGTQGGQYQGAQQYPSGQGPPYPPPGGPGAYGRYEYGPPPRPNGKRTGLIIGAIIAAGVLIVGVLGVVGFNMLQDSDDKTAADSSTSEAPTGEAPTGEGPTADEPAQPDVPTTSCLPYEPVLAPSGFDLTTGCDSPEAFWRIVNSSDTTGAAVTPDGALADIQVAVDLCGADYGRLQPGELWKDWYFTYDNTTLVVEQLLCVEALGNPDASGRMPIMPDTGSCFDDSDRWWTVPCDQPEAVYSVADTVAVEPPRTMTPDEAEAASASCSGGAIFWQVLDAGGHTTHLLCGDELLLA